MDNLWKFVSKKKQYLNDKFAYFRALTHKNFELWPKSLQFLESYHKLAHLWIELRHLLPELRIG